MKTFEIYSWQPPGWPEPHPCVIVSSPARASGKPDVEVVLCSSKKAGRAAQPGEIILDAADGLDCQTLCKCDQLYSVARVQLKNRRGVVSGTRRGQLIRTIIAAHGWGEILAG
jgi:mRNA-degrading endonuclease toxin of MazEF toxin-antitoxin module